MRALAAFAYDRRRLVLVTWIAAIAAAFAVAGGAGGGFVNNFTLPGTESQRALDLLEHRFPQQSGDSSQIVFGVRSGKLSDPARRAQIEHVLAAVRKLPHVASVQGPATQPRAVSPDGRVAFATLLFDHQADALDKGDIRRVIRTAQAGATNGLEVELGGQAIQLAQQPGQGVGELVGIAVAIVVLVLVLGSLTAMLMPLIVAAAGIALAMGLVLIASSIWDIADFASSLALMIALGVGIDYALLVISRFRSERSRGEDIRAATMTAMDTAGRAVLFAGSTVVIALLGMVLLGISFLNGPAVAAALAVLLTMVGSLTLLPALLGFLGHRVKLSRGGDSTQASARWGRYSAAVQRHPKLLALGATILLLVVAAPATGMRLASSDAGSNAPHETTRKAYDLLSEGFGPGFNGPLLVVAELRGAGARAQLDRLPDTLRAQRGVAAVGAPALNPAGDTATISLYPTSKPQDAATKDLLERLRGSVVPREGPLRVSIGGSTAATVDMSDVLASKLPLFILVVVGLSLLLLAIVFRSLLIPLKAAVMNVLSISAALGTITFVFQDGHLASLLGVNSTAPIEPFMPVFMFAIVFGLSMDYEVFLVTRMHEEWERGGDAALAVRRGLALTGRIVTAAAVIMVSVFGSFMLGDDRVIKLFGLGLASAVFFDAFVIRLVLVPSLMYLFGRASWWMPPAVERRLPRVSVEGPEAAPSTQ